MFEIEPFSGNPFFFNPYQPSQNLNAIANLNPLQSWAGDPHTAQLAEFNPSLYQDFTFTIYNSITAATEAVQFEERFGPGLQTIFELNNGVLGAPLGSSTFAQVLGGSNVYTQLFIAVQSIIWYDNAEVSSYYSESLSYQVNVVNLTAALDSVSNTSDTQNALGQGLMTATTFAWSWELTQGGWTGAQLTGPEYLTVESVNSYLEVNWGDTYTITNSTAGGIQIQNMITVETNDLETAQTYLDNSSTSLESQISLAGTIINSLQQTTFSIIRNI